MLPVERSLMMTSDPAVATAAVPLIGREAELAMLRSLLERAVAYHAPQVVLLIGNQGTGKTRLLSELAALLPPPARAYFGAARDGDRIGRYPAIARLLRHRLGIADGDGDEVALERL